MPIMVSSGLTKFLDNKYFPPLDRCRVDAKQDNVLKPISLSNLVGVFLVFLIGIAFSSVTFFLELLIKSNWDMLFKKTTKVIIVTVRPYTNARTPMA